MRRDVIREGEDCLNFATIFSLLVKSTQCLKTAMTDLRPKTDYVLTTVVSRLREIRSSINLITIMLNRVNQQK